MISLSFHQSKSEHAARIAATALFTKLRKIGTAEVPLSRLIESTQYGFTASATESPVGPHFVRITDLKEGEISWPTVPYCECSDVVTYRIEKGDLLFARTGATTGKTHLVTELPAVESVFASYLIRVRPRPSTSVEYLNAFFQSDLYWQQLIDHKSGSAQPNVNATKLSSLRVPVVDEEIQEAISRFMKAVGHRSTDASHPLPQLPPPLSEQPKLVEWLDAVATRVEVASSEAESTVKRLDSLLMSAFHGIAEGVPHRPLEEIAPLTRRPAEIDPAADYPGISARSFGRGTFHNPPLLGSEITWQKPYEVKAGDILVSNIKAWEGAISVVSPEDEGRFGSHRYLTFAPKKGVATPHFVCFYLLSPVGLFHVGEASPGSADRNRTTGSKAMQNIPVPVPTYERQLWFDQLYEKVEMAKRTMTQAGEERNAILPSVLNQVFSGDEAA